MLDHINSDRLLSGANEDLTVHTFVDAVSTNRIEQIVYSRTCSKYNSSTSIQRWWLGKRRWRKEVEESAPELTQWFVSREWDLVRSGVSNSRWSIHIEYHLPEKVKAALFTMANESTRCTLGSFGKIILDALRRFQCDTFEKYFWANKYIGLSVLFQATTEAKFLIIASMLIMNASNQTDDVRINLCAELLAISWHLFKLVWRVKVPWKSCTLHDGIISVRRIFESFLPFLAKTLIAITYLTSKWIPLISSQSESLLIKSTKKRILIRASSTSRGYPLLWWTPLISFVDIAVHLLNELFIGRRACIHDSFN